VTSVLDVFVRTTKSNIYANCRLLPGFSDDVHPPA